jgi:hypothetical protein
VIWHHHPGIENHFLPNLLRSQPFICCNLAVFAQLHFTSNNFTKQTLPLMGAKGDEIGTRR